MQPSHRVHVTRQRLADFGTQEAKRSKSILDLPHSSGVLFVGSDGPSALFVVQIIEKRRRDRINHSLSELRRLVPSAFEKQVRNN